MQIREIVHETAHGTAENSDKKGQIVTGTAEAARDTAAALQKIVDDSAEKSAILQKNVAQASFNAEAAKASAQ